MGQMSGILLPITLDSGAQVTVLPEEIVKDSEFTRERTRFKGIIQVEHEGRIANVSIQIGGEQFERKAVAVPGRDISWTAAMSLNLRNQEELKKLLHHLQQTSLLPEEETHFLPPRMEDGKLKGAVSQGIVVAEEEQGKQEESVVEVAQTIDPEPHCEEEQESDAHAGVEASEVEADREESLEVGRQESSSLVEAEADAREGSADSGEDRQVCVKDIVAGETRETLAKAIRDDSSLATARTLANQLTEGYHWVESLLFRTRQDNLGDNVEQLCLPNPYQSKCMLLAHESFGHAGRNRMCQHIRKYFYWPSMTLDVSKDCKSCETCQKQDKQVPKPMLMQKREIVTVPSERVCVDLVGPLPTAKGGFHFLLTYIDMATRWPEAIPLKKTTTR